MKKPMLIINKQTGHILVIFLVGIAGSINYQLPSTWEKSKENKMRFELLSTVNGYKSILTNFDQAMKGKYTQIIRTERIQNERWFYTIFGT